MDDSQKLQLIHDLDIRTLDNAKEANYSLWNALLSYNGVLIGIFSGFASISSNNKCFILSIVILGLISSGLLILNYVLNKKIYHSFGNIEVPDDEQEFQKFNRIRSEQAQKFHRLISRNEKWSLSLLPIQAMLILILILLA